MMLSLPIDLNLMYFFFCVSLSSFGGNIQISLLYFVVVAACLKKKKKGYL
jgi:hypothetical protein